MTVLIAFAFLAGIVTILSPCILPVLPIVLSGSLTGGKKRPFGIIVGFIVSFTFFTVFSFALLRAFGVSNEVLRTIAIVVLLLFGLGLLLPQLQVWLEKLMSGLASKGPQRTDQQGFGGGVLVGLSLGLFWTPCVGPILASVITIAATSAVTLEAIFITLAYALGTALPMLGIALGGRALLQKIPWVTRNTKKIQKAFGVIMILLALALHYNLDRNFQIWILDKFPQYGSGLTKLEENEAVKNQLDRFREGDMPETSGKDTEMLKEEMENAGEFPAAPNPDFQGATKWLNSEPLTLEALRGKVVLVDFWTYTCINCIRTLPYLTAWHEKYADDGLVIIGVHAPEFAFEANENNVRAAMADYGIEYVVVQDNEFNIWRSYDNHYWPAKYFIDKNGRLRHQHFGEGKYAESEELIRTLLEEDGSALADERLELPSNFPEYRRTPESYLGYRRMERFASPEEIAEDALQIYSHPAELELHELAYEGGWTLGDERAMPEADSKLHLNFEAKEVYLVMRSNAGNSSVHVLLDDELIRPEVSGPDVATGIVTVQEDRLYRLVNLAAPEEHILTLEFLDPEVEVYAFTFG